MSGDGPAPERSREKSPGGSLPSPATEAFQRYDVTGDGVLDIEELAGALKAPRKKRVGSGGGGGRSVLLGGGGGGKMEKRGGPGGGLLMVACSGFYVHLKSVFPLIRF